MEEKMMNGDKGNSTEENMNQRRKLIELKEGRDRRKSARDGKRWENEGR